MLRYLRLASSIVVIAAVGLLPHIARGQADPAHYTNLSSSDYLNISGLGSAGVVLGSAYASGATSWATIRMNGNSSLTLAAFGEVSPYSIDDFTIAHSSTGPLSITGGTVLAGAYGDGINNVGITGPTYISGGDFQFNIDGGTNLVDQGGTGPVVITGGTSKALNKFPKRES